MFPEPTPTPVISINPTSQAEAIENVTPVFDLLDGIVLGLVILTLALAAINGFIPKIFRTIKDIFRGDF